MQRRAVASLLCSSFRLPPTFFNPPWVLTERPEIARFTALVHPRCNHLSLLARSWVKVLLTSSRCASSLQYRRVDLWTLTGHCLRRFVIPPTQAGNIGRVAKTRGVYSLGTKWQRNIHMIQIHVLKLLCNSICLPPSVNATGHATQHYQHHAAAMQYRRSYAVVRCRRLL